MSIKRYDMQREGFDQSYMAEVESGSYVRYEDHAAEVEALRADAERMNWLQSEFESRSPLSFTHYGPGVMGCELFTVTSQWVRGYGIRGAIDAARTAKEQPPSARPAAAGRCRPRAGRRRTGHPCERQ